MLFRCVLVIAALAAATACTEEPPPPDRFSFSLALDNSTDGSCSTTDTCESFAISCGAIVGVRLLDLPPISGGNPAERDSDCVRIPAGDVEFPLCDLGGNRLTVTFERIPRENGMVEVVVWPDTDPTQDPPVCPELEFDLFGRVKGAQFDDNGSGDPPPPEPAFARREYFDFSGQTDTGTIRLGCHKPDLVGPSCRPISTYVRTQVRDLAVPAISIDDAIASELTVRVGQPTVIGEDEYEIETAPILNPGQVISGSGPFFELTLENIEFDDDDDVCILVRDDGPQTTTATSCTRLTQGNSAAALFGYLVGVDDLNAILTAANISEFPLDGVVVGRVLDNSTRQPVSGVSVSTDSGSQVLYLDDELESIQGSVTSRSGYFVSTDAPFTTKWNAMRGDGLRSQVPAPRAGLLKANVTVVVLLMSPTVAE